MSELGYLLLGIILLHAVSEWRWHRHMERMELQWHRRWQRMASLLTGMADQVDFGEIDPQSSEGKVLIQAARKQGLVNDIGNEE